MRTVVTAEWHEISKDTEQNQQKHQKQQSMTTGSTKIRGVLNGKESVYLTQK